MISAERPFVTIHIYALGARIVGCVRSMCAYSELTVSVDKDTRCKTVWPRSSKVLASNAVDSDLRDHDSPGDDFLTLELGLVGAPERLDQFRSRRR